MLVGILSDSHGEIERTRQAMKLLEAQGCTKFIHLGDVEIEEVLDELIGYDVSFVFGNCDWVSRLHSYAVHVGIDVRGAYGDIVLDGKRIAFLHGHDETKYQSYLDEEVPYLLHGHTHEKRDELVNKTRCINPGALHRASVYTVAVLDTSTDSLVFLEVCDNDA
ncbi:MAG: metallophosphoesterase family protein [Phycisphaerales bacterium]|jgi:hypothetical protein|nr:metallophosphoesterase family protein [Phycisphaerales bacterium]